MAIVVHCSMKYCFYKPDYAIRNFKHLAKRHCNVIQNIKKIEEF